MKNKMMVTGVALFTAIGMLVSGCGSSSDYDSYSAAYKKVTANGGMNADFNVTLTMDGTTTKSTGNFLLDTSDGNNVLYYEMEVNGKSTVQFSDGEYLYTNTDGHQTKYALNAKPSASGDREESSQKDSGGAFNTTAFLEEFSGFMEAGKIKELGLLSPIDKATITEIKESNGVYTLSFSENLIKNYLNILVANETQSSSGDTLQIDELNNFVYTATVSDGIVTGTTYSGTIVVNVPANLMESGEAASYDLDFVIDITFQNPGDSVTITLPSTDGYEEL